MQVLRDVDEIPAGLRFVLAIGMFDGVHRGHRRVVAALTGGAQRLDATPMVLTFDPHPAKVLRGSAPPLLCDPLERLAHLARLGVEATVVQRFTQEFADQPPEDFLTRLCEGRTMAGLVMTAESAFGRDRTGGLPAIRRLSKEFGYHVIEVPRLSLDGATLSSTRLRGMLANGRLAEVKRELGRPYAVIGTVVRGDQRGRELGYPTANLTFDEAVALPRDGIYAVRTSWNGAGPLDPTQRADGVASLGMRPTFESDGERILEVHVFDFDGDLYGMRLRVELVRRLRGEKRFSSAAALVAQMDRDAERARTVLAAWRDQDGE